MTSIFSTSLAAAFLVLLGATLARAVWIQVVKGPQYAAMALRQHRETIVVPASRGTIVDRNGEPLAIGRMATTVYANPRQVADAHRRGYAAALIVGEHPADGRAYPLAGANGFRVVPCPEQSRDGITCASCRLCMDSDRLHERKLVIGFAAHGSAARQVRLALNVLNG